jgi:hypothetical protein
MSVADGFLRETESSDSFVASAAASIATGWSEPVPGREFHPLKSSAFHGALLRDLTCSPRSLSTLPKRFLIAGKKGHRVRNAFELTS